MILTIDELDRTAAQDAATLKQWLLHIAKAVDAKIIISPAIGTSPTETALEQIAQDLGIKHRVCAGHAIPHFMKVVQSIEAEIMAVDVLKISGSKLETVIPMLPSSTTEGISNPTSYDIQSQKEDDTDIQQVVIADLERLHALLKNPLLSIDQQSEESKQQKHELEELHLRQLSAHPPCKGERATISYRLRILLLRLCNIWPLLTDCGCPLCQHLISCHYSDCECEDEPFTIASNEVNLADLSNILAHGLLTLLDISFKDWAKECCRRMRGKGQIASLLRMLRLAAWFNNQLLQSVSLTGRTLTGTVPLQNEQTDTSHVQKIWIDWFAILS